MKSSSFPLSAKWKKLPPSALTWAWQAHVLLDSKDKMAPAQEALNHILSASPAEMIQERRRATELFYGSLRYEIRIDWLLGQQLRQPGKLPLPLWRLLHIACHALCFMDRMPDYAVISQSVSLARSIYGLSLGKLVNGVLRNLQRLQTDLDDPACYCLPQETADDPRVLSRCYSLPLPIWKAWEYAYGREKTLLLAQRSLARPWPTLRVNAHKPQAQELRQQLLQHSAPEQEQPIAVGNWGVAFAPSMLPAALGTIPLRTCLAEGRLSYQSAGSQWLLERLLPPETATTPLWDVCSGYGNKAAALGEQGWPIGLCTDISQHRLHQLPQHFQTLGLSLPPLALADACHPPLRAWHGNILADVPCSGLGVLARRPDIRRHAHLRLADFPPLQKKIVAALAHCLQPGHRLVYITCTLHPQENEQLVACAEQLGLHCREYIETPWELPYMDGMFGAVLEK